MHYNENDKLPLKIFVKCNDCGSSFCGYEVKKKNSFIINVKKRAANATEA